MLRAIRCRECGSRFYTDPVEAADTCQDCSGSYDPTEQAKADAAAVKNANARPKSKKQSFDPRNPDSIKD